MGRRGRGEYYRMVIFGKKAVKRIEELEKSVKSLSQAISAVKDNNAALKKENKELKAELEELKQTLQNYIDDGVNRKTGQQLVKEYLFGEEEDG